MCVKVFKKRIKVCISLACVAGVTISRLVYTQAAQTLFEIYIRDSIALRFEPFKRMCGENRSKFNW